MLQANPTSGVIEINTAAKFPKALFNLLNLIPGVKFFNIKFTKSIIDVKGSLEANIVRLKAASIVNGDAGNSFIAILEPLTISIVDMETGVSLSGNAKITAGQEVTISSDSELTLNNVASTGILSFSLALTYADNETYSSLSDQAAIICPDGKVTISSKTSGKIVTKAEKGKNDKGNSGGYFAIAIVTSNASAKIEGASGISAGVLNLSSVNSASVITGATAKMKSGTDNSSSSNASVNIIASLASMALQKGAAFLSESISPKLAAKLNKASKKVIGGEYAVSMNQTENGTVTASVAKADYGDAVTLHVAPDSGYKIKDVSVWYRMKGESSFLNSTVAKDNGDGSYTFQMPKGDVKVTAVFEKGDAGDKSDASQGSGDGKSLQDIVDDAAANASDADLAVKNSSDEKAKEVEIDSEDIKNGAIMVSIVRDNETDPVKILPGKMVKIVFNPEEGYVIDTLQYSYAEAGNKIHTVILNKNKNGEYIFKMPNSKVLVHGTFKKQETASKESTSSTQLAGAIAVSIVSGEGCTSVNTTGSIISMKPLQMVSSSGMALTNSADSSATGKEPGAAEVDTSDDILESGKKINKTVAVTELRNGSLTASAGSEEKSGTGYSFSFTPRIGYKSDSVKLTYKNCIGETVSFNLPKQGGSEDTYYYSYGQNYSASGSWSDPKYRLAADESYKITANFVKIGDGTTVSIAKNCNGKADISDSKADKGEKITFTLNPAEGYSNPDPTGVSAYYMDSNNVKQIVTIASSTSGNVTAYGFEMPGYAVTIEATFVKKAGEVDAKVMEAEKLRDADGKEFTNPVDDLLKLSDSKAVAAGEKFTIDLTDRALLAGLEIDTDASEFWLLYEDESSYDFQ